MGKILVVGLGPGADDAISIGVLERLKGSENVIVRTQKHPIIERFNHWGIGYQTMDEYYQNHPSFGEVYQAIVNNLLERAESQDQEIIYAVPGSPLIAEATVELLRAQGPGRGVIIEILPAQSFLDAIYTSLAIDPTQGLQLMDALVFQGQKINTHCGVLICQVYSRLIASELKLDLLDYYDGELEITVIRGAGIKGEEKVVKIPLYQLDHLEWLDHLTTVYLPPAPKEGGKCQYPLDPLTRVMDKLLGPAGCPWDRKQDHQSLKPYLIEECYEVLEAIDNGEMYKLCEELGDLLLQVVFHGKLAEEGGQFDLNQVVEVITEKMVRRHPHVFQDLQVSGAAEVLKNWEMIKAQEKGNNVEKGLLDQVSRGLPALIQAYKIQEKAAKVGFDWPDIEGPWLKVHEELAELKGVVEAQDQGKIRAELGDVFFALVNLARFLKVSPEDCLLATIRKFRTRFHYIEEQAKASGKALELHSLEELDRWWDMAKNQEIEK